MINIDVSFPTSLPVFITFLQTWQIIAFVAVVIFGAIIFWILFKNKSGYDGYYLIYQNEWGDNFKLHPIVGTTSVFICLLYTMVYILIYSQLSALSINNISLLELYPSIGMVVFLLIGVVNIFFGSGGLGV